MGVWVLGCRFIRARPNPRKAANAPRNLVLKDANNPGLSSPDLKVTFLLLYLLKTLPFEPAIGALQRPIDVVVAGISGTRIGFGEGHFIVNVCVLVAQAAAAGSACSSSDVFTEPALHKFTPSQPWGFKRGRCPFE